MDVTIFGCEVDEAAVFRERAPYFGITPVLTAEPVSEATAALAANGRCVSVGHKSPLTNAHLDALSGVGVRYVSTRSVGFDHVDVEYARGVGITVGNVAYSPDSVADHTLMLMLLAVRRMRSVLRGVDARDYRLSPTRGAELRDLTIGVVGTGRIGSAVIDRLRGFGCRILASDRRSCIASPSRPDGHMRQRDFSASDTANGLESAIGRQARLVLNHNNWLTTHIRRLASGRAWRWVDVALAIL